MENSAKETKEIAGYLRRWEALKSERATTESEWQDVADYSFPRRDFTTTRTPGTNRNKTIYDSTGIASVLLLASALHGNLTPTQTKWFAFKSSDDTRGYFDDATDKLLDVFASPSGGFSAQMHEMFLDMVAFGTGVLGVFNRNGRIVFKTLDLNDCWVDENEDGVIDTLFYSQKYTADQMVSAFGQENVHESILKQLEKPEAGKKFTVLNCVKPRKTNLGRGAAKKDKPFESSYVDIDNKHLLKEDGYDDFPYVVGRFAKRSGEVYGFGAGMQAKSEVQMLNKIVEVMLRAATKNADPPVLSPIDGVILPMRLDPGGINYYDPDVGAPEFWSNGFRPDYMDALIAQKREDIKKIFFIDWLSLPNNSRMTATETSQRAQDSFRNMSAVNARMEKEVLSSVVRRVFLLMVDNGDLALPPPDAQGKEIKIEYTSPMALAQKSISANALLQGMSVVAQLAQLDPSVASLIDTEVTARDQLLNTYFIPAKYLRSPQQYKKIVSAQQEAAASAQMSQNMQGYTQGAKNVADAVDTLGGAL